MRDLNARLVELAAQYALPGACLSGLLDLLDEALALGPFQPDAPPPAPERPADRYEMLELIAEGGMGAVWRVYDPGLQRSLAMKLLLPEHSRNAALAEAFIQEARLVASLDHPSILPIYSFGRLPEPDGRAFFTMREVRGRTFGQLIEAEHTAGPRIDGRLFDPLRRLVRIFQAVCAAVAFAHQKGVLHRDLKPGNVMVGELGEVYVMDWGLARLTAPEGGPIHDPVMRTDLPLHGSGVQGTVLYLAPELGRGEAPASTRTDIYALGAMLYHVLAGHPPYRGSYAEVLRQLVEGPPAPVRGRFELPAPLVSICQRAMAREPLDRYPDAATLAAEVEAWLEGAERLDKARELVAQAAGVGARVAILRRQSERRRAEAQRLLRPVPPHAPEREKLPGWRLQDEADVLELDAELKEVESLQLLRGALIQVPDFLPAHAQLARHFREEHEAAEARNDAPAAARYEILLRNHDRAGEHGSYLAGKSWLSLRTREPVEVELYRYVVRNRRLQTEALESPGPTPICELELDRGSYLALLLAPDGRMIHYPFQLSRQEHHAAIPPDSSQPQSLPIPPDPGSDRIYVPAGWFRCGGDPRAYGAPLPAGRVWVEGLLVDRFPVTNRQYIAFLDDLVARGQEQEALHLAPRERAGPGQDGALVYGRRADGGFCLQADADGDLWQEDWPVVMIPFEAAAAYARWRAAREGLPWRLPYELEWEKAARGVDGRLFPWGNWLDPTWCCMRESNPDGHRIAVVNSFPVDESPYGVRGMGGNVYDWCADDFSEEGPLIENGRWAPSEGSSKLRVVRGGSWDSAEGKCRVAYRSSARDDTRSPLLGFRLFCAVPNG